MDDMLRKALRKTRELRNQVENVLLGEDGDIWEKELKNFLAKRPCWVKEGIVKIVSPYLHLLTPEPLTLTLTDGIAIIAKAGKVFTGYIDSDFVNHGTNVPSEPTDEMKVEVCELIKDGQVAEIFGSLSTDLDSLCLTQPQIIQFVQSHRNWLRTDGYGTFFLFKATAEFFVAVVDVRSDGRLNAYVFHFDYDRVWRAEYRYRIVVPQLVA